MSCRMKDMKEELDGIGKITVQDVQNNVTLSLRRPVGVCGCILSCCHLKEIKDQEVLRVSLLRFASVERHRRDTGDKFGI